MGILSGQTAMVVGASSGMGRATALALATAGCRVVASARRAEALRDLAVEAAAAGGEMVAMPVDVTSKAGVEALVEAAVDLFGRVDLLVNAAGVNTPLRALRDLTDEEWYRLMDTNLNGAYRLTRAILPQMRSQGGGLIIHIGSISGRWPDHSGVAYAASKFGLVGLAHVTMMEEMANGIRVSVLFPGLVDTPLLEQRKTPPRREIRDRSLKPEDIAAACVFLASLPPPAYVPEMVIMPAALQCIGYSAT